MLPTMLGLVDVTILHWWHRGPQSLSEILPSEDFEPGCLQTVRALPGCFNAEGLLSASTGQTPFLSTRPP